MKKVLFLLSLLIPSLIWAGPVSRTKALGEAVSFIKEKHPQSAAPSITIAAQGEVTALGQPAYYIFNIGNDQGFVVVAGDDRTTPIIGYSNEGNIDKNRMPDNMKAWLDACGKELKTLAAMDDAQATKRLRAPRQRNIATRNSIAPLITSKWDQATPYWNECPQFMNSNDEADGYELAYTGCVATAMAQIMYYHKYPTAETNEIPAYSFTYSDGNFNYSTVQMPALPPTTFDWEHMRDTYTGAEDEVYTAAVAHLMFYVGCAAKMQYGRNASGAYTDDIPPAFRLFGYGSKLAYRNDYTQEAWDNLVYEELKAGRPMIYNGTAGSGGGHSFICDGFEYGDYFHINWGWGGMGNGFFQLSILNPSASGIGGATSSEGYNMKQNIIYNIIPGTATGGDNPVEEEPTLTATNISGPTAWDRDSRSQPFKIHKSKIVKLSFSDHEGTGKKFKEALALFNTADSTYTILDNSPTTIYSPVTTSALGQTVQFGSGIQSNATNVIKFGAGLTGTYRIVGMYQLEGTTEWKPMKESDRYYIEVVMNNTACTATYHPAIDLSVTDWSFTGEKKVGSKLQVNATVKNNSADRFFGDIYLNFGGQQIDEYSQYTTVVQTEVLPGQEKVVTFNLTPATAGTKTVTAMLLDKYGGYTNLQKSASVTITESAAVPELNLSVDITADNAEAPTASNTNGTIYDSHVRFKATIKNNTNAEYNKYVLAPLFICKWDSETQRYAGVMVTYKQQQLSLAAGEEKTLSFDFDNLAYGSVYSLNIYARNNVPDSEDASHVDNIVKPGESKFYAIERGIVTWTAEGARLGHKPTEGFTIPADAAAVSLEGLTLSALQANANPNTLYYLGSGQVVPTGLEGKNVITAGRAASIVLEDGYDFYTPQTFSADNISYARTFTEGHSTTDNSGWSTIVLPFPATAVHNQTDGTDIDWQRASYDSGKQLWICYFAEEDGEVAYFRHAPVMQANVPYIVAVPDNSWTDRPDLRGKRIVWSAVNATVKPDAIAYTSGNNIFMAGTFVETTLADILPINNNGNAFQANASQTIAPFRAYFDIVSPSKPVNTINIIIIDDNPTGITNVNGNGNDNGNDNGWYTLEGQRLNCKPTQQGIYLHNGKKVSVRK